MRPHAKLSPSAAHRWSECTASPALEAQYAVQTSSYAEEGTAAHSLAELLTRHYLEMITPDVFQTELEKLKKSQYYSQEMQDYCEEYALYIKERLLEIKKSCPDAFVELEVQLDLSKFIPEGFGTADCIIVAEPILQVIDFKYGKGVKVEAEGNLQMEIYALGAVELYGELYDIEKIQMTIVQPRNGGISHYSMEKSALRAWASVRIIPAAKEAFNGPGVFRPGEKTCKFCRAAKDCKARADYYMKLFDENPIEGILTNEEAGEILQKAAGIEDWLTSIKEKVEGALMQGDPVPGWKLVEGKSNRKYEDEEAVANILRTKAKLKVGEIYTKKLIGITSLEKLIGKKKVSDLLGDLIIKPEGKPTLAPANDKRPEIHPTEEIVKAFDE